MLATCVVLVDGGVNAGMFPDPFAGTPIEGLSLVQI